MPPRPQIVRHRAGKPTGNSSSSDSDSDNEQEQQAPVAPPPKVPSAGKISSSSHLNKADLAERRRRAAAEEEKRVADEKLARAAAEDGFVTEEESEGKDDGEEDAEESGEESSSEEESSEDERPRRTLMMRPKFIPKSQRNGANAPSSAAQERAEAEAAAVAEEERRKAEADAMIEEQIRKDLAAKAAGKHHWDDEMDLEEDVDTEDDPDDEAEYAAWKVRELKRIKRDREAVEARERELAEIERRRNLTEEERRAEDDAHIAKQRDEKDQKGKMAYLGKYHHRGAFYQDSAEAEGLVNRDIMGAKFQDEHDRSLLPKALQIRDMTKLGKKGASKYRDLKSEDTGRWAEYRDHRPGKEGFGGGFGLDDRFKSDRERDRDGPGGANAIPLGERTSGSGAPEGPRRDRGDRRRDEDGRGDRDALVSGEKNSYKPRDNRDDRQRRRSRSRSRSPNRDYRDRDRDDRGSRRKRDSSREPDRYESDKRRRVDSR